MNILFDVDGVLADFTFGFTKEAVKLGLMQEPWHTSDPRNNQWSFDFHVDKVWQVVDTSAFWWELLDRLCEMDELKQIENLTRRNRVVFCTNRKGGVPYDVQGQTWHWLNEWGISYPNVVVSKDKGLIAKALEIDVAIDDRPENLDGLAKVCKTWCLDQPYNRDWKGPRVGSVTEFLEELDGQ